MTKCCYMENSRTAKDTISAKVTGIIQPRCYWRANSNRSLGRNNLLRCKLRGRGNLLMHKTQHASTPHLTLHAIGTLEGSHLQHNLRKNLNIENHRQNACEVFTNLLTFLAFQAGSWTRCDQNFTSAFGRELLVAYRRVKSDKRNFEVTLLFSSGWLQTR